MFTYFYHERIRKSVAIFGSLFNEIYVLRKDADGSVRSQVRVPLSYAPREKFLDRIREQPDLDTDTKVAIKLPRMSFEIVSYSYDAQRQLSKTTSLVTSKSTTTNSQRTEIKQQAPFTISFQLNIYARTQDDALQVVEQILPFFNPQYTLTIKPFTDIASFTEDVPIIFNGMTYSDNFEGSLEDRRAIIYTLEFDMHANFYGPLDDRSIIRDVTTNQFIMDSAEDFVDLNKKISTITVLPNPLDANPDSDFGFTTTIVNTVDSA